MSCAAVKTFLAPLFHHPMLSLATSPERLLQKSLRLPRTSPNVAHWLFDEPYHTYHSCSPPLTATAFTGSVTIRIQDCWKQFGNAFDPFQSENPTPSTASSNPSHETSSDTTSPITNNGDPKVSPSSTTFDVDMVLTPALRPSDGVVAGYALCTGPSFDGNPQSSRNIFCHGKLNCIGRFAYDSDNDHIILIYHAIAPNITAIIEITSNSLSRNRFIYAVPFAEYHSDNLPSRVITVTSCFELRTSTERHLCQLGVRVHPNQLSQRPCWTLTASLPSSEDCTCSNNGSDSHADKHDDSCNFRRGQIVDNVVVPKGQLAEVNSLVTELNYLTPTWEGTFVGENVIKITNTFPGVTFSRVHQMGEIISRYYLPSAEDHHRLIFNAWKTYSSEIFGLLSCRTDARLLAQQLSSSHCSNNARKVDRTAYEESSNQESVGQSSYQPSRATRRRLAESSSASDISCQAQNDNGNGAA